MATAATFDPCRCFYNEEDAFPPLARGCEARLLLDQQTQLIYGLGDDDSSRAFQYVVVDLHSHDGYSARYFESVLPAPCNTRELQTRKELHFYCGRRVRNLRKECLLATSLCAMREKHGKDLLRAHQMSEIAPVDFEGRMWLDVLRVLVQRVKSLGGHVPSPEELLLVARRTERQYPPPSKASCCSTLRRRWWRFRLRGRLSHHFPVLSVGAVYLLSEDVAYVLQYPTYSV